MTPAFAIIRYLLAECWQLEKGSQYMAQINEHAYVPNTSRKISNAILRAAPRNSTRRHICAVIVINTRALCAIYAAKILVKWAIWCVIRCDILASNRINASSATTNRIRTRSWTCIWWCTHGCFRIFVKFVVRSFVTGANWNRICGGTREKGKLILRKGYLKLFKKFWHLPDPTNAKPVANAFLLGTI